MIDPTWIQPILPSSSEPEVENISDPRLRGLARQVMAGLSVGATVTPGPNGGFIVAHGKLISAMDDDGGPWTDLRSLDDASGMVGKFVEVSLPAGQLWHWDLILRDLCTIRGSLCLGAGMWSLAVDSESHGRVNVFGAGVPLGVGIRLARGSTVEARPAVMSPRSGRSVAPLMRPELADVLARHDASEQTPKLSECSACKGWGTLLAGVTACPSCEGTGSVVERAEAEQGPRFTAEAYRDVDGDTIWAIEHGRHHQRFVMTSAISVADRGRDDVPAILVLECTGKGGPVEGRSRLGPNLPGTFTGEHDHARAIHNYVASLNGESLA